jgi:hypothetical protein
MVTLIYQSVVMMEVMSFKGEKLIAPGSNCGFWDKRRQYQHVSGSFNLRIIESFASSCSN